VTGAGRPFRFVAVVGLGWTSARLLLLWQETGSLPAALGELVPIATATAAVEPMLGSVAALGDPPSTARMVIPPPVRVTSAHPREPVYAPAPVLAVVAAAEPLPVAAVGASQSVPVIAASAVDPVARGVPASELPPSLAGRARLSVSSWLIARNGRGLGVGPNAPQLGGSQGGVRVDYGIGRGLALTGRAAAPAAGAGRELSLGVAWRPTGVPVRIVAEQRFALDGGAGGPALGISGGVDALPLAAGFTLEGYGQGGAIVRRGLEHYADASLRASRLLMEAGGVRIDVGAGAWGGTQRGVSRLDVGPSIGARVPLVGRTLRLSLDWRQRIAGDARPGSGPALSVGSDF
jgi:hypothetical protein